MSTQQGDFCWNELATTNVQKAKEFYKAVLGWSFEEMEVDNMTYTVIKNAQNEIGGIWEIPTDQVEIVPPHWKSYILVENLEETLKKIEEHGGKLKRPITKVGDMGRLALVVDPTNAFIAFWETCKK